MSVTEEGSGPWVALLPELRYSQSLERGLAILRVFTAQRPVLGIADIADYLGMSRSTTHRYVVTLVALSYLEQTTSRKYRLGLRVTDLGMAALCSSHLYQQAHPYLVQLRRRTSHTVGLGVLDGTEVLYIDRVHGSRRAWNEIDSNLHPGSRVPVYCTAIGKLLLANLPESQQRELITSSRLTKRTKHTITSKKALREELETVRGAGIAASDQEFAAGVAAIALPVRNEALEVIAAVSLEAITPPVSPQRLEEALGPHLRSTAEQISARLGSLGEDKLSVRE
jgi:IclR family pca regulon transcriptional regulator